MRILGSETNKASSCEAVRVCRLPPAVRWVASEAVISELGPFAESRQTLSTAARRSAASRGSLTTTWTPPDQDCCSRARIAGSCKVRALVRPSLLALTAGRHVTSAPRV